MCPEFRFSVQGEVTRADTGFMSKKTQQESGNSTDIFGRNLTELLKSRGISQRAAAELISVNPSVIHDWCSGAIPRDLQAVAKLCKALSVDFQWLLTGEQSPKVEQNKSLEDFFEVEEDSSFSGIFQIEAKRLRRKSHK